MSNRRLNAPAVSSAGAPRRRRNQNNSNPVNQPQKLPSGDSRMSKGMPSNFRYNPKIMRPPEQPTPYVASVVDPVSSDAAGIPDFNTHATAAQKLVDVFTLTGFGTAGGVAAAIVPAVANSFYYGPTVDAGGANVTSWGSATSSDWYASLSTDVYEYRLVSGNVTVENIASASNEAGTLYIGLYSGSLPATPVSITGLLNDDGVRCPAKNGASVNIRPYSSSTFLTIGSSSVSMFPIVVVGATGIPTAAPSLLVTVTWNIELIYNGQTLGRTNSRQTSCSTMECCIAANCHQRETTVAAGPDAYEKLKRAGFKIAKFAAAAYLRQHGIPV